MLNVIHVSFFKLNSVLVIIKESQIFLQKIINQTEEDDIGTDIIVTFYEQQL